MPSCAEGDVQQGDLLIRYTSTDNGTRPFACDGSVNFWSSDAIWLKLDGDTGMPPVHHSRVAVGKTYFVMVEVTNIGKQEHDGVNVQAWVNDFTVGIGPVGALASAGGALGLSGSAPAPIPSGQTSPAISCGPWTVAPGDLINVDPTTNLGHVCAVANVYTNNSPQDGLQVPPGTFPSATMCCNSHHGQHNLAVEPVFTGKRILPFHMMAANPFPNAVLKGKLAIKPAFGGLAFGAEERQLLIGRGLVDDIITLPPELIQFEERFLSPELVETKARALINLQLLLKRPDPNSAAIPVTLATRPPVSFGIQSSLGSGNNLDVTLQPGERMPIEIDLELNPDEPVGSVQTFDVVQTDENGDVVGGARIVTVITPD